MFGVLDGPRQASWQFSIAKDGRIFQHVDTDNIAWTNGGYEANKRYWAIECEGQAGEPLTQAQLASVIEILRWLWQTHGLGPPQRRVNLWEHNEFTAVYGYPWTACPSGRIPWATVITGMDNDMFEQSDRDSLNALKSQVNVLATQVADLSAVISGFTVGAADLTNHGLPADPRIVGHDWRDEVLIRLRDIAKSGKALLGQ